MKLLILIWVFMKLGFLSFGGGYVLVPLLYKEMVTDGYLTEPDYANIVAIAEMTPGPIAVNTATFVGYRVGGIIGSILCTAALALPSFIMIIAATRFILQWRDDARLKGALSGIRPVIVGMIAAAVIFFFRISVFPREMVFDGHSFFILLAALFLSLKLKLHPVFIIGLSGLMGAIVL